MKASAGDASPVALPWLEQLGKRTTGAKSTVEHLAGDFFIFNSARWIQNASPELGNGLAARRDRGRASALRTGALPLEGLVLASGGARGEGDASPPEGGGGGGAANTCSGHGLDLDLVMMVLTNRCTPPKIAGTCQRDGEARA